MNLLVTGTTGFVGTSLVERALLRPDLSVRAATRSAPRWSLRPQVEAVVVGEIHADTAWNQALAGIDIVVHSAAKVHDQSAPRDALASYRAVNTQGTINLARQAARAGVSRFVFLSSVKVSGEEGRYTESDSPAPLDAYAMSKHEAERGLRTVAEESRMEIVIVRPPLVYGPGVRANFRTLMRAVALGIPLPFAAVTNKRSFVGLDNLVDFVFTCVDHPAAANNTFFVSDGEDLSTPDLIRRLSIAIGKPAHLVFVPPAILRAGATVLGRRSSMQRLLSSLQVDIAKARGLLGWQPGVSVDEGLRRAAVSAA